MDYDVLATCPLFSGLARQEIEATLSCVRQRVAHLERGEVLFHVGDRATHVGIVLAGSVGVHKVFPAGDQVRVTTMRPGNLLGEGAVFSKQATYPCDVVAQESSEVLLIGRSDLLELLRSDGRIMENFVGELATATYRLQWRIELLSHSGIRQKVAFYLLTREGSTPRAIVRIPSTVTAWAMELNVSRTSLHRELRALCDQGIIAIDPPQATILDARRLSELL